jgi:hygromycin-B 4-O-kinase
MNAQPGGHLSTRPRLSEAEALTFVRSRLGMAVDAVRELPDGHISQPFAFSANGDDLVIRFARAPDGYRKDELAHRTLHRADLPVPPVIDIGEAGVGWYAISARAPGSSLKRVPEAVHRSMVPAVTQALLALMDATPPKPGWGYWDERGVGAFHSWSAHLLDILAPADSGFYAGWTRLLVTGELDRALWDRLAIELHEPADLLDAVRRGVVHSDFGGDNIIADGGTITGVIDWGQAAYGDAVYDLANLTFWYPELGFAEEFLRQAARDHPARELFQLRLRTYELHHGTLSLRFYAHMGMRDEYDWTRRRVEAILPARR